MAEHENLSKSARRDFFLRVEQVGQVQDALRDDYTLPLFPLWLILDADGTLAADAQHLVERYQA